MEKVSNGNKMTEIKVFQNDTDPRRLYEEVYSKENSMTETDLQKVYICHISPRDFLLTTDKGLLSIDNGSIG